MPPLNVALVPGPAQVVVRLTGEADLSTTPLLTDALAQAAGLGTARVVVDIAATHFWDCSGLHALADFTADLARAGRQCRIVGASAAARRLVVLADFATLLVLDGPLYLPAVAPEPARAPRSESAPAELVPDPDGPARPAAPAERRGIGRRPVPAHGAPSRRGGGEPWGGGRRAAAVTLRRWG